VAESASGGTVPHPVHGLFGGEGEREPASARTAAVYLALGVTLEEKKELLGMWISENEGAKFWLAVCTELRNRDTRECFIACVDGLTGLPEAIEAVFPHTQVQLCMVHMVRNALKYVNYKQRKEVAADLRAIYSAATSDDAEYQLEVFARVGGINSILRSVKLGERIGRALFRCSLFQRRFGIRDLYHKCH